MSERDDTREKPGMSARTDQAAADAATEPPCVFLYNKAPGEFNWVDPEWVPEVRSLTELTGIGDETAGTLADDVQVVDDLVDQDLDGNGLSEAVTAEVASQYHDELRTEIYAWYGEACLYRSEDDLELFDQAVNKAESKWWQPIERLDGVGETEAMCQLLRTGVEPGDQLKLTSTKGEELTVRITDRARDDTTRLEMSIQAEMFENGILRVPKSHFVDLPVLKCVYKSYEHYKRDCDTIRLRKTSDGSFSIKKEIIGAERIR